MLTASQIRQFEKNNGREKHPRDSPIRLLGSPANRQKIRDGEREAIEDAIYFLEVDSWFWYSGYIKDRLVRALKAAPLNSQDKERLRIVLCKKLNGPDNTAIRSYWGLLRQIWTPDFEVQLLDEAKRGGQQWKIERLQHYLKSRRAFFDEFKPS